MPQTTGRIHEGMAGKEKRFGMQECGSLSPHAVILIVDLVLRFGIIIILSVLVLRVLWEHYCCACLTRVSAGELGTLARVVRRTEMCEYGSHESHKLITSKEYIDENVRDEHKVSCLKAACSTDKMGALWKVMRKVLFRTSDDSNAKTQQVASCCGVLYRAALLGSLNQMIRAFKL